MDSRLIYAKTPVGDEAVRQSTRVVQRNLRMVLLQVDGTLTVEQLVAKIGNQRLVEGALRELEEGGFIEVATGPVRPRSGPAAPAVEFSAISQFSTFGPRSAAPPGATGGFSAFSRSMAPFSTSDMMADRRPLPPPAAKVPLPPVRRIAPGRWLLGGIGGIVLLLLAVLLFYPYGSFRPGLEAELSRQLAVPVRIGGVGLGLLPRPRLLLSDVTIGGNGEGHIASLAVASPYLLFGAAGRILPEVEVSGVRLTANRLVDMPMFGGPAVTDGKFPVRLLRVTGATVAFGDLVSPEWNGEVHFLADGSTEKASFRSADGSLRLEATPTAQGVVLAIDSPRWNPEGMPFGFEALQVDGLLQKNRLLLQKVDTNFLGGLLKGNWLLDWSAGMVMAGEASLTRLDGRRVTTALAPNLGLEGELSGTLRMRANGSGWQDMLGRIEASLDARVARGQLNGIDLGELVRRGGVVQAGATHFETLQARLDLAKGRAVAREITLDAGLMTANGRVTVEAGGQVDGRVTVQARSSVSSVRVPAQLSGTLPSMVLTATE